MNKETCYSCVWSTTDVLGDRYCVNDKSDHCADYVGNDGHCELWESKNERQA